MKARLSLHRKAEEELYKLGQKVKGQFYDFSHYFRDNPDHPGLDLKPLKGDSRLFRAKISPDFRALLAPIGVGDDGIPRWLVLAVRDRKDVYEHLQVAVNRVTGAIEFVDLSVVGDSALRRAGIALPTMPDAGKPTPATTTKKPALTAQPLLAGYSSELLLELGVAQPLIPVALAVTTEAELDSLLQDAPLLSKDILYALAAQMSLDEIREQIVAPVKVDEKPDLDDFAAAVERTPVTALDDEVRAVLEEGDFRAWKVFLHPAQARIAHMNYRGPARVSGGPGTGKTIVALHRVKHLVEQLPDGTDKPILLTTYTANLATDLRLRLASLLKPEQIARVDVTHIDQLAARVLGENTSPQHRKQRTTDQVALTELRQLLAELGETTWEAQFLFDEWEQVILGQAVTTRADYFRVRRAGRGRAVTRTERARIWSLLEQLTARLDKRGLETWGQAAERAARYETDRARRIEALDSDDSTGRRNLTYRYRHVVVDEAQDLRAAHWKMLRAMANPASPNDLFIAGDTHQRIYDHQVTLGPLGINIRGRSSRLTLSYRTTGQILDWALGILDTTHVPYDDLDDGTDALTGYRSVLRGPKPVQDGDVYPTFDAELAGLTTRLKAWRAALSVSKDGTPTDPTGRIAVCVADRDLVIRTIDHLTTAGLTCAELTKDGPHRTGEIHVGTMHRFKGLEYQNLAIIAASDGIIPRAAIHRYETDDPARYINELRKARSLLFVAATRARDTLAVTWHGTRSPLVPVRRDGRA